MSDKKLNLDDYDESMRNAIVIQIKKREKRRRAVITICSLVGIVCIGYFGIYSYMSKRTAAETAKLSYLRNQENSGTQNRGAASIHKTKQEIPDILEKYNDLYNKNKKLIGWLKIADTIIDYPVMQSENEEYYLDHNFNQEYDKNGSIFMDADCDVIKPSTNLILYGHHMKSGQMFGTLKKYRDESYYKKHTLIQFDSIYEEGTYEVMYAFQSKVYSEEEIVFKYYQFTEAFSKEEFDSNMEAMAAMSLYDTGVTAQFGDRLLTLSTCDYDEKDGRFVVVAKRINP